MSDPDLAAKADLIAVRASAIDSGASEDVFGGGTYGPDFSDIPALFAPFEDLPDRDALRSHAQTLGQALQNLVYETQLDLYPDDGDDTYHGQPEFDAIESIAGEMNNWVGASADSFQDAVATPAPRILPNQFWAVRALKLALEAEASLWDAVHQDIHGIADEALNVLDHVEDKGPIGFGFTMTVIGAIAAVTGTLSAPATGGASLALVLAVWGGVKSVSSEGSALLEGHAAEGDSPQDVAGGLRSAVANLRASIVDTEQKIADGLTDLTGNLGHPVFHFAKPTLVAKPDFTGHI